MNIAHNRVNHRQQYKKMLTLLLTLLVLMTLLAACTSTPANQSTSAQSGDVATTEDRTTAIANLVSLNLTANEPLRVVATTSLIGDAARHVGDDAINLAVLLPAGTDPHAYTATPQDMITLSNAHLILVNGLGLEESLLPTLQSIEGPVIVSVNEGVPVLGADATDEAHADNDHAEGDPHTWQSVNNVRTWVANSAAILRALDPAHAELYTTNAATYDSELAALHDEIIATLAVIPHDQRKLVTDHDDMAYFAQAYDFTIAGSVVPSFSSMATISAQEMAALQDQVVAENVRAIFAGNTINPRLAEQVAGDTGVQVVSLFTDSLSVADGPAPDYPAMMRYNATHIAAALQ